ncbi:MAG: OB-fold nucleic acid binding domain-containing protein, partial [Alphaproteobacteria bacterium]|nr:OB-fold nucleic acid binding domain-containing protein [Alphaproteobacteria bacterium]
MVSRGYARDFAERCFRQIEGFGTYGFPESHAASFALLVYASAWLKCHHPAHFAAALLNAQPMGFYAPAQIVRDAREHGVPVRPVDVTASTWDCTIEAETTLRLGLRLIGGFREDWSDRLDRARTRARLTDFADLVRSGLPRMALEMLADADAMRGIGLDRRAALWQVRGLRGQADLPLFASEPVRSHPAPLPVMTKGEHVIADYKTTGLSLKAHPMRLLRNRLAREGIASCAEATLLGDGARVTLAGLVLVRQRPGEGTVVFATLEDETGQANIVVWESLLERYRGPVVSSSLLFVEGHVQRVDIPGAEVPIVHIVAVRLEDRSPMLDAIGEETGPQPRTRSPGHPRQERVFPRSRDFQ